MAFKPIVFSNIPDLCKPALLVLEEKHKHGLALHAYLDRGRDMVVLLEGGKGSVVYHCLLTRSEFEASGRRWINLLSDRINAVEAKYKHTTASIEEYEDIIRQQDIMEELNNGQ